MTAMYRPNGPVGTGPLTDLHLRELTQGSGIDPDVIAERGYRSMYRPARDGGRNLELYAMGFPSLLTDNHEKSGPYYPALFVPMFRATGMSAGWGLLKPGRPYKGMKYVAPRGKRGVDLHPRWRDHIMDLDRPLWITEGVKKADALTSRGQMTAGILGVYNWRTALRAADMWEDVPLKGRRKVLVCFDSDVHSRADLLEAMRRLGAYMKDRGVKEVLYVTPPPDWAGKPTKGIDDYFAVGGTLDELRGTKYISSKPPKLELALAEKFSDHLLAAQFQAANSDDLLWTPHGGWHRWNDSYWEPTTTGNGVAAHVMGNWAHAKLAEANAAHANGEGTAEETKGWLGCLGVGKIRRVVDHSEVLYEVAPMELDSHPHLLNCTNGTVDLRTGEIVPHRPDDLITKTTGLDYDPQARSVSWSAALEAVPAECRDWLRRWLGMGLYGQISPDDKMLILLGGGSNGKSTIKEAVVRALGGYATTSSDRLLMPEKHGGIPVEYTNILGRRLVAIDETPDEKRINVKRLKDLAGTPQLSFRKMYVGEEIKVNATHSMILSTNHRPVVTATDRGTWRRLLLLDFPYTYMSDEDEIKDPEFHRMGSEKVRRDCEVDAATHRAVLAWLVSGAIDYARDGVSEEPERVRRLVTGWRRESDTLSGYIDEYIERVDDPEGSFITCAVLHKHYCEWLIAQHRRPVAPTTLSQSFKDAPICADGVVQVKGMRVTASDPRMSFPDGWPRVTSPSPTHKVWVGIRFR